jgi:pyruvate kinase
VGRFPAGAVRILQRVTSAIEREYAERTARERLRSSAGGTGEAASFAACELAARLEARAIVAPLATAAMVLGLARLRPRAPIVAVSPDERVARSLAMVRGVAPLHCAGTGEPASSLACARDWLFARGLARPGDPAVLLFSSDAAQDGTADTLRTVRLE